MTPEPARSLPLIDPDRPYPANRFMPPTRGEGMTGSPIRLPRAGKPGPEDDNAPPPEQTRKQHKPSRSPCPEQHAPNGVAVKAPAAATRSGSAQALTPTPTSTRPARTRKLVERTKTTPPLVLTGPSPSGMTCGDAGCLTRCHRAFVSNSCHFFRTHQKPLRKSGQMFGANVEALRPIPSCDSRN